MVLSKVLPCGFSLMESYYYPQWSALILQMIDVSFSLSLSYSRSSIGSIKLGWIKEKQAPAGENAVLFGIEPRGNQATEFTCRLMIHKRLY